MWTNVCVEGFCFGDTDDAGNYPCGKNVPSPFCLMNKHCPHFAWAETTERQVAHYPPLRFILWDRLKIWITETVWGKLSWWFWDCLWFNRRKVREFFDSIPVASCPEWDKEQADDTLKFDKWFKKAQKDYK